MPINSTLIIFCMVCRDYIEKSGFLNKWFLSYGNWADRLSYQKVNQDKGRHLKKPNVTHSLWWSDGLTKPLLALEVALGLILEKCKEIGFSMARASMDFGVFLLFTHVIVENYNKDMGSLIRTLKVLWVRHPCLELNVRGCENFFNIFTPNGK